MPSCASPLVLSLKDLPPVVARLGNQAVFSVDALGLRPLWYGETEKEYFITSERGVYALDSMSVSPKPMAPGEKIAMTINTGQSIQVMDYPAIQQYVYGKYRDRKPYSPASGGIWFAESEAAPTTPATAYPMPPSGNGGQSSSSTSRAHRRARTHARTAKDQLQSCLGPILPSR